MESRIRALRDDGQPLPKSVRTFFDSRFGQDFSQVRIHTNLQAAELAQTLNAQAYTLGHDIGFGTGKYAPETVTGRRLLAHELTHVIQQKDRERLNLKKLKPADIVKHHLIPKEIIRYRRYRQFARRLVELGIDIDRYIVGIPHKLHNSIVHKGPRGGNWNREIIQWFRKNRNFTKPQLEAQLKKMKRNYKIPKSARTFMRRYPLKSLSEKTLKKKYKQKRAGIPSKKKPRRIKLPKAKTMKEVRAFRRIRNKAIKKATNELAKKMSKEAAKKLAIKLVLKFGAKLILKAIPIIGWISLAWDIYDVIQMVHAYEEGTGKKIEGGEGEKGKEKTKGSEEVQSEVEKLLRSAKWDEKMTPDIRNAIIQCGLSFSIKNLIANYRHNMVRVSNEKVLLIKYIYLDKNTIEELSKDEKTVRELKEFNLRDVDIDLFKKGQAKALKGIFYIIYQIIGKDKGIYLAKIIVKEIVKFGEKKVIVMPLIKT